MDRVLDAVILGLVQGLTEFLPISSSGHLALFQRLLGWNDPSENVAFSIAVHVGSLGAVMVFVRREIIRMLTTDKRMMIVLAIATLPVVVAGLGGAKDLVAELSASLLAVGICLCATGGILTIARRLPDGSGIAAKLPYGKALLVGISQVLALLPGISRSGTTLSAGLGVGLTREEAVRFAFLMAAPAIAGAAILEALDGGWAKGVPATAVAAGIIVSFLSSLWAMKVMVGVVVRRRLHWFAIYCVAVGLLAIGLSFFSS